MNKPQQFKDIVYNKKGTLMPVAHDALTALLIERAGFECYAVGGFGVSAAQYGYLDMGYISRNEIVEATKRITSVSSLPALIDADTGYGGPNDVKETVQQLESAGAASVFIEDQEWPKRCGHIDGKSLISADEMQAKLQAAVAARKNKDLVIIARTDAIAVYGLEEALRSAKLYHQAGAEMIFVEAPTSVEEVKTIAKELSDIPLLVNMIEGGKTPIMSQGELIELGFSLIAYPLTSLLASAYNIERSLKELKENGKSVPKEHLLAFSQIKNVLKKP